MGLDQLRFGQLAARFKKLIRPIIQRFSRFPLIGRCVIVDGFEAKLERLGAAQAGAAIPGYEVWRWIDFQCVWLSIHGSNEGEDRCLACGRNAGDEAGFPFIDHLTNSLVGVHGLEPFTPAVDRIDGAGAYHEL